MSKKLVKNCYAKLRRIEWQRLIKNPYRRLEFETTMYFLKKHLPKKGLILDAGGGPGRYTIELAKLGYDVVLLDLTPELLAVARKKIRGNKVGKNVRQIMQGSIDDLSMFRKATFDGVVCLGGPLSHIMSKKQRNKAVDELIRVAKTKAPIFVSVIGRNRWLLTVNYFSRKVLNAPEVYRRFVIKRDLVGGYGFAPTHFYIPSELENHFKKKTKILKMVGLEGIFSAREDRYNEIHKKKKYNKLLWEVHLKTCTHPSVVALSEQFMIICKK